ncbi:MAG: ATP-binding cassette domain-containing protein [Verrucomicrobiales bacterium]|nr:ATP-binding cassette domain-containing protein [Verrucomicrobiales bacterium]
MIEFDQISIRQGTFRLENVSFQLPEKAYTVLMGKTGCGKTTLLEILCGLRRPHSGTVRIFGEDVTSVQPGARQIGYVPQDRALFPHLTVRENLAFALRLRSWSKIEVTQRVNELAGHLGVAHLLDRWPERLSGGESQRVALGRALAPRPRILCLDEPLSALDEDTREEIVALLKDLHHTEAPTILHITHSSADALELATCRLDLVDGQIHLITEAPC